jgi:hypothetical protein
MRHSVVEDYNTQKSGEGLGLVVRVCNPSYAGGGGKQISIQGWSWAKKHKTLSEK